MDIRTNVLPIESSRGDLLVVNLFEGVAKPAGATGAVDKALGGLLVATMKECGFIGKEGETVLVQTNGTIPAKRVVVIGFGKKESFTTETVRRAAGVAVAEAKRVRAKKIVSALSVAGTVTPRDAARALVEGTLLSTYQFLKYKKDAAKQSRESEIKEFTISQPNNRSVKAIEQGIAEAQRGVEATTLARDLVNEPPSTMTPRHMVEVAEEIAKKNRSVKVKVFGKTALERMGSGGLLGIARGSAEEPFLIHLLWKPARAKKRVAICGKGVTFDSGGISIKPGEAMYTMKCDMAGGAAILGLFSKIRELNPDVEVHGVIGACENMPSALAIKPGDVVKTMSGKTIEVLHTDAEGRVILSDVLTYAQKQKPDYLIDLATLTGSCVYALGDEFAGLMGNDDRLLAKVQGASVEAGEQVWQLPLPRQYADQMKSDVADLKNTTDRRYAGAIMGGMFLQEFVEPKQAWAHLDIAGPAFAERPYAPYIKKGGTGFGVRTLIRFLKSLR